MTAEYQDGGKGHLLEQLKPALTHDPDAPPHYKSAEELCMTVSAVRVALHRLRKRYQKILRAEVVKTVATASDVEEELRDLVRALR